MPLLIAMLFGMLLTLAADASARADPQGTGGDEKAAAAPGKEAGISIKNDPASIKEGQSLFNQICAHCHGPNAITGQSERNLRHLRIRYGNDMAEIYRSTVLHGRPDKGMPVWGEILDGKTIDMIYAYLNSVQSEPE
jgi:polar amino acid transport system substrate-binding protein